MSSNGVRQAIISGLSSRSKFRQILAQLIVELAVLVGAGLAEITYLLGFTRAVIPARNAIELPVNRASVTTYPRCGFRRAESGCFIALYLVSLIKSQVSVSVCHGRESIVSEL
jgi:hypothetical protein